MKSNNKIKNRLLSGLVACSLCSSLSAAEMTIENVIAEERNIPSLLKTDDHPQHTVRETIVLKLSKNGKLRTNVFNEDGKLEPARLPGKLTVNQTVLSERTDVKALTIKDSCGTSYALEIGGEYYILADKRKDGQGREPAFEILNDTGRTVVIPNFRGKDVRLSDKEYFRLIPQE